MTATILIDQAGIPAGTADEARTDGLATGALVTLSSVGGALTHKFELLSVPTADGTAVASLIATGVPSVWTFSPDVATPGNYRILLITDEGLPTEDRSIRIFGIRTASLGLVIAAWNEVADPGANLENAGAQQIDRSENNEPNVTFPGGSPEGWWPAWEEALLALDALVLGAVSLQTAYAGGPTIVQTAAGGTIVFSNVADDSFLLRLARTFAGTSPALDIIMDVATTGVAIAISENGAGGSLSMKATLAGLDNQAFVNTFGIGFLGTDNDFEIAGSPNPLVGSQGRLLKIIGAPGAAGDAVTLGGPGAPIAIRGGAAGADGGFGGNVGGPLELRAGAGSGAAADGIVDAGFEDLNVPSGNAFRIGGAPLTGATFTQPNMDAILRAPQQATQVGDSTTTSLVDVLIPSMTLVAGVDGNYKIEFSTSVEHSAANESVFVNLYVNGVLIAHTERLFRRGNQSEAAGLAFEAYVTGVLAAHVIEARWRTTAATATAHERTLIVEQKV